ncbi:kinase-like domain-containing protein [Rhizophagus clarus]|uniref:Kinase-like domain-containing protein n=1 Tax=Rhizophagus clarus TaxID=94130 RepID=A0A8H3LCJ9_9GLOM|nr:kinase-like domain-containing protein [Rhizophagus clarus]
MSGLTTLDSTYSIWKDGPLHKKTLWSNYTRESNKVKRYSVDSKSFFVLYGISKNPYTNDYILVQNNYTLMSGNEKFDDFIHETQLKIDKYEDVKDGPLYNEDWWSIDYTRESNKEVALKCLHNSQNFIDSVINEAKKYSTKSDAFFVLHGISKNPYTNEYILVFNWASGNDFMTMYSAMWKDGPLHWKKWSNKFIRYSPNKKVALKCLHNSQNFIESVINEAKRYSIVDTIWKDGPLHKDNYWGNYTRESNKEVALKCLHNSWNFVQSVTNEARKYLGKNCFKIYGISQNQDTYDYILVQQHPPFLSGNNEIDYFIQERQLEIENYNDIIFRWIPYNYFSRIEKIGSSDFTTVYSATCKVDPLHKKAWRRINYAGVFKKTKIKDRISNKEVALKCLHYNSWNFVESVINEVKKYLVDSKGFFVLCGMSKNPNTGDYILVFNWTGANKEYPDTNDYIFVFNCQWISGNKKIDEFVQERQLQIKNYNDIVFEWIPYNHFSKIEKTGRNDSMTIYSAIWKDGPLHKKDWWSINYTRESNKEVALRPLHNSQNFIESVINEIARAIWNNGPLYWDKQNNNYMRDSNKEVVLKCLHTSQNCIDYLIYETKKYSTKNDEFLALYAIWKDGPLYYNDHFGNYIRDSNKKVELKCLHNSRDSVDSVINESKKYSIDSNRFLVLYGISQDSYTNDYILVQNHSSKFTNWISGNEKIDYFIQEMQIKIKDHNDTVFEWIPYNHFGKIEKIGGNNIVTIYSAIWEDGPLYWDKHYIRGSSNKKVALKYLYNSQNSVDCLINEARKYSAKNDGFLVLYGISQNPNTNNYILVQNSSINLTNWISGNEKIDDFIQEMQLKINHNDINNDYTRDSSNKEVALKCLHNSQNFVDFVINEAKKYSTNNVNENENCFKLYGISQNLDTNEFILVQSNYINSINWMSENEKIDDFIQKMQLKINPKSDVVFEWIQYCQFNEIKEIGKGGFSTVYSAIWKNGPLHWYENKRSPNKKVALKRINNSQNLINELLNEVKVYTTETIGNSSILKIYGISRDPVTKNYIIVLHYAAGGNFDNWISINENYKYFDWKKKIRALYNIASGLEEIHEKKMVHHDFHTGNILFGSPFAEYMSEIYISDMGLCGEVGNVDKTQIYGILPYVAPEVLRGKPYTQAADIYSFGMIMYFVATGRQPFDNCAHDNYLVLDICRGIRPEINEEEGPKRYIDLMKKCWHSNSKNRPNITELNDSLLSIIVDNLEIEKSENYRNLHLSKEGRQTNTHPQAIYISRLLNPFTDDLPKYDYNSECSDCIITTNLN